MSESNDTEIEAHFHKLMLAEGNEIPINAVVKDADGQKHKYKFSYRDVEADIESPGELEPDLYSVRDVPDPLPENLQECKRGIEQHTQYTVWLKEEHRAE